MNMKIPWNKKLDDGPTNAPIEPRAEKAPIDFRVPREMLMLPLSGKPGPCPRCGGALQQTTATYLVATWRGERITDSFMMGSDFGWFCVNCPVVVIDENKVREMLSAAGARWDIGAKYAVMGIVDLDAVPEDKQNIPLGDPGNPMPLVEFTNVSAARVRGDKTRKKSKKHRRK